MKLNEMAKKAHAQSRKNGWWDEQLAAGMEMVTLDREKVLDVVPLKLALVHSEVSEAMEDYRVGKMLTVLTEQTRLVRTHETRQEYILLPTGQPAKPEGFPTELADQMLRIMDLAVALDIDLEHEIQVKHEYNCTRPHRHGDKLC